MTSPMAPVTWLLEMMIATLCLRSLCDWMTFCDARTRGHYVVDDISNVRIRHGKYLHVTTLLIEPYVMIQNYSTPTSNDVRRYHGYLVDVLDHLGAAVHFRYMLHPAPDGEFGFITSDGTNRWTGLVGQLLDKKADFAAAPMYPTTKRLEVLDFSLPFMTVTASVVIRKRADGSHLRLTSIGDVYQRETMYIGTQGRGLIYRAIRSSNSSFVRRLYERMRGTRRLSFTETNEQGLERVRNYDYAFILPRPIAEYVANRKPCDLHVIGTDLFRHRFALATAKGSSLMPFLSDGLRLLTDSGDLDRLYRRWWYEKGDCSAVGGGGGGGGDTKRHVQKTMRYEHVSTSGSASRSDYVTPTLVASSLAIVAYGLRHLVAA